MQARLRQYFDEQLEQLLPELPTLVHRLLDQVPLVVEDHPSDQVMAQMGARRRDQLCGLYSGIPLSQRHVDQSGVLSDAIHIYREGIIAMARRADGRIDENELRRQMRITILHELGHHHGLDENQLRQLGY